MKKNGYDHPNNVRRRQIRDDLVISTVREITGEGNEPTHSAIADRLGQPQSTVRLRLDDLTAQGLLVYIPPSAARWIAPEEHR